MTSREPLHLRLEQLLNVEPLAEADGISLFVDRARAVNSAFQLTADNAAAVGELCARLDELPLAIELAASRARLLTPRAILERLGLELLRSGESDRPDRHRSLRAAVAWSYGQLSSAEQRVFRQLAVFVGGCTLDACDAVLGPVDPPGEAHETSGSVGQADQLDLLQSLVDRSLLRSEHLPNGAVRLRMLETIRSFALEQLTISGEETAVRRRHAEHFVALVGPLTDDPDLGSVDWLDCMEAEHDNIRACLRWCLDTGDNTTALTLASAVHRFWWTRGYLREGLRWLEEGLACPDGIPLNQLAWAQHAAGGLAWRQGEYARAEAHYAAGLALRREIGDPFGAAIALQGLASVARDRGDARRSVELWEECLAVFRAASNRPRIARATLNLAIALLGSGEMDRADQLLQETVTLANEIGQYWALATALAYLALVAVEVRTDYRRAGGLIKQGLELEEHVTDGWVTLHYLDIAGWLALQTGGEARTSATLLGASGALQERMGTRLHPAFAGGHERTLAALRDQLSPEAFGAAWDDGRRLPPADLARLAESVARAAEAWAPATLQRSLLTEREREVVRLVARGMTSREIADLLVVSERTIETHVDHVRGKLGVRSRAQIAAWAIEHGLVATKRG